MVTKMTQIDDDHIVCAMKCIKWMQNTKYILYVNTVTINIQLSLNDMLLSFASLQELFHWLQTIYNTLGSTIKLIMGGLQ